MFPCTYNLLINAVLVKVKLFSDVNSQCVKICIVISLEILCIPRVSTLPSNVLCQGLYSYLFSLFVTSVT